MRTQREHQMDPDRSNWLPMILTGMLVGAVLVVLAFIKFRVAPAATEELKVTYADMAAIVLTGVSVMVAVLAVFVAALAIWGYSQFGKVTENASRKHLERLLKDGPFKKRLDDMVIEHVSAQLRAGELRSVLIEKLDSIVHSDAQNREQADSRSSSDRDFED